jgi:hypothetical protein
MAGTYIYHGHLDIAKFAVYRDCPQKSRKQSIFKETINFQGNNLMPILQQQSCVHERHQSEDFSSTLLSLFSTTISQNLPSAAPQQIVIFSFPAACHKIIEQLESVSLSAQILTVIIRLDQMLSWM